MGNKYTRALKRLALDGALSPEAAEKLINASAKDGGPGSGNFGHAGRKGMVGGSSKSGTNGAASGNLGTSKNGTVYKGEDYSLVRRGLRTITRNFDKKTGKIKWSGPGMTWEAKGKKSKYLPNGSGTTRIPEKDIAYGCHTINKFLTKDGKLAPERAKLHEKIIQNMFKGKKPKVPGEQKTLYFLGGGSASGKSSFTNPDTCKLYGMPSKHEVTVIDPDVLKDELPEFNKDLPTGTQDRNKAANFAHEESSALGKRALEAAFANGYDVTMDGTGNSGAKKVIGKIEQARKAGYRVEGRYCTASIENALARNIERSIKQKRLVDKDSVVNIHKDVSAIFEEVAPHFDHIELWDHDGPEPVLVATCERGGKVDKKNPELYQKFLDKAKWEPPEGS